MIRARTTELAFLTAVCLVLVACAGLAPPRGFQDSLAYAHGAHTAVLEGAAASVTAGDLSPEDGEAILEVADQARALLDAARAAYALGDIETAEGRLALSTELLRQLQAYLRSKGAQP